MYKSVIKCFDYVKYFEEAIKDFGGVDNNDEKKYVFRNNTEDMNTNKLPDEGAYFGCISKAEEPRGQYSDLCVVVFPSDETNNKDDRWIIALGIGSLGYKNDYQLASLPGTRRMFVDSLQGDNYIKTSFIDIESTEGIRKYIKGYSKDNPIPVSLTNAVKKYYSVILAGSVFDPNDSDAACGIIRAYLALYAKLRDWPTNDDHRKAIRIATKERSLKSKDKKELLEQIAKSEKEEILNLLLNRKYIVLQGAPGTGKTRMAKEITRGKNVFFTQFHAETTYSDFVYGIVPDVDAESLKYEPNEGVFVKAVRRARDLESSGEHVYLIIDEINRANLANVLGPCFYLFEPSMKDSDVEIKICPGLSIDKLPDNFYVIATMNTADRSLAVVDFALRRRFAWYTMHPHIIKADNGQFREKEFNDIAEIFRKYATDDELNLQPGQAYFIVPSNAKESSDQEIKVRMKYEVMPLIKEYLMDGMLSRAKDEFVNYFREYLKEEMYR